VGVLSAFIGGGEGCTGCLIWTGVLQTDRLWIGNIMYILYSVQCTTDNVIPACSHCLSDCRGQQ
jgi:hypothetical protein